MIRPLHLTAIAALLLSGAGASAQGRFDSGRFSGECRPPLKYAAGACVPECPAGYSDEGRTCEFRRQGGGGNGN